jgi:zinc transport system substrate-binding protein
MVFALMTSCSGPKQDKKKISIVTTIFPEYDWVMQILGDRKTEVDVTLLLDKGVDLHSYQATVDDMVKIANCDMFIYVGGESDFWVEKALENPMNKNRTVINLMKILGSRAIEEEGEEGEVHEHDEHVWLSLKNAVLFSKHICTELSRIDDKNAKKYLENTANYLSRLTELDENYSKVVNESSFNTLIVADRFPFAYLCRDYNIQYYAAFDGCSADTEASFETIIFLAGKLDELGLNSILQIESSNGKIANTLKQATKTKNQKILTLNSMQSTNRSDVEKGETYLSVMEKNLLVLKDALS